MLTYDVRYSNMTDEELCHEFCDSNIFIVNEFARRLYSKVCFSKRRDELINDMSRELDKIEETSENAFIILERISES